ncbi:MAG: hypothetical protein ACKO40_03745 [Planctomycetaceae bacterium]
MTCARARGSLRVVVLVAILGSAAVAEVVEFSRVRVPEGRSGDLPLGGERYVPMRVDAFERAVGRRGAAAAPRPMLDAVAYDAAIDDDGRLAGTIEFDLDAEAAAFMPDVVLGRIAASRATLRTTAGVGEVGVFGTPSGSVAIRTPVAGRYACHFVLASADGTATFRMPLAAALVADVRLRVPAGLRPVVTGEPVGQAPAVAREGDAWRITAAGVTSLVVMLVPEVPRQARLRVWNHVRITGRRAEVATRIVPEGMWLDRTVDLVPDRGLTLTAVHDRGMETSGSAASLVRIDVPGELLGTRTPLCVDGVAPFDPDRGQRVPLLRAAAATWAGGGCTIVVDPPLAVEAIDLEEAAVVGPAAAAAWPLPIDAVEPPGAAGRERAAVVHVEDQSAAAGAVLRVTRRPADFDVTRVTTVEVSPGAVVGRAACDIRVEAGEAFGIVARVEPGWFIDAVEAVDWQADVGPDAAETAGQRTAAPLADATRTIEWRVVRTPGVAELRIDLAEAATRNRSLGLRITGHRRGVPLGGAFVTSDMDMVRLEGESPGSALLDFRVGPEAVVEIDGSPVGILAADGRFAQLVEPGSARARIPGGVRAAAREARLVQRRPPLDAEVQVQLVARDGQLAESTTITCRPDAGAIDSVVVHFSEPLGDAAAWTLLHPEGTTVVPRRLDAADDGSLGRRPRAVAESWLLELRPGVEGAVTLRAARTRPFTGPVPAPLAWVEGATDERGTLVIRGAAGGRPAVVNRGLWELPPEAAEPGDAAGVVAEFRYAGPDSIAVGDEPPADVIPVPAAEARAWAWHELTTVWCHEAGRTEFESRYDVENRGRGELVCAVPAGTTLREIIVDGEPASFDVARASAADVRIDLPADRVRCELVVRGEVATVGGAGARRVALQPCTIDAPVLGRHLALMLPPALEVVGHRPVDEPRDGVLTRLLDARLRSRPASSSAAAAVGFRRVEIASSAAGAARTAVVVRRDLLASMSILVWIFAAAVAAWALPRAGAAVLVAGCVAAVVALWIEQPLVAVARAAWWGVLTGGVLGLAQRRRGVAVVMAAALMAAMTGDGRAADPWRVYFPDDDAGMALVPEPLHRLLAEDEAAAAAAVRVRSCRLRVPAAEADGWTLALEIEADRGGVLVVRQQDGCRWALPRDTAAGTLVDVTPDGREARIVATSAGLRSIVLGVVPAVVSRGLVESCVVALPPAARAEVSGGDAAAGGWQCDRRDASEPWSPARSLGDRFDVSHATAVRLSRSRDPRHPLADAVRDVISVNEVEWSRSACRLRATFEIDAGAATVRTVVIRTSPGLRAVSDAGGIEARPLPGDRWVAEVDEPAAGRTIVECGFELPLVDPVGLFDVPFAWIDRAETDVRTVRCLGDAELDVVPELPAGLTLFRPRDPEPALVAAWRTEAIAGPRGSERPAAGSARAEVAAGDRVARVSIRRRPIAVDVTQRLDVAYAVDHVALTFEAEIDSLAAAVVTIPVELPADAVVDRFSLRQRDGEEERAVDAFAARADRGRLNVVVQRPRSGRYHLKLDARVPGPPARTAAMPLMRSGAAGAGPLVVTWRSADDILVEVAPDSGSADPDVREVAAGEPGPVATVSVRESGERGGTFGDAGVASSGPGDPLGASLDSVMVHVALDGRGRLWGLARFDLATATRDVMLRMPSGMRVFDILIDGREARAVPVANDGWSVSLHDIRWPRTMLVVFAGDVAGRPASGDVILVEPPRIDGVGSREVLWSIDAPAGIPMQLVGDSEPLDIVAWAGRRDAARQRMATVFERALENVAGPESGRLAAFARRRDEGEPPALESAWDRAFAMTTVERRLFAVGAGDRGLTLRAARVGDPSTAARGGATLAILAVLAAAWGMKAQRLLDARGLLRAVWPWVTLGGGLAWVAWLRPALPGWTLLAVGGLTAVVRLRPRPSGGPVDTAAATASADASTQALPPA